MISKRDAARLTKGLREIHELYDLHNKELVILNQLIAILTNFKDLGEWSKTTAIREKELEKKLEIATSKLKYLQSGEYRTKLLAETLSKYQARSKVQGPRLKDGT